MNAVFVDTSALLALLNAADRYHARAASAFRSLRIRQDSLLSTSYVLVETYALAAHRFGLDAVQSFRADFAPLMDIVWVDEALHNAGLDLLAEKRKRTLSLADAVSFVTMRQRDIAAAFSFDSQFEQEGFSIIA